MWVNILLFLVGLCFVLFVVDLLCQSWLGKNWLNHIGKGGGSGINERLMPHPEWTDNGLSVDKTDNPLSVDKTGSLSTSFRMD